MAVNVHREGKARNVTGFHDDFDIEGRYSSSQASRTNSQIIDLPEHAFFHFCQLGVRITFPDWPKKSLLGDEGCPFKGPPDAYADNYRRARIGLGLPYPLYDKI